MTELPKSPCAKENLRLMNTAAEALIEDEDCLISGLSNLSAVIAAYLSDINWAGFYLLRGDMLYLGPFQGLPACTRIAAGKGVCGTAVAEGRVMVVDDVHAFPGHIACDSASNSEIVLPLFRGDNIAGVLDIDSPLYARFGEDEQQALLGLSRIIGDFLARVS